MPDVKARLTSWRTTGIGLLGAASVAYCGATGGHLGDPNTWIPAVAIAALGMFMKDKGAAK